MSLRGSGYAALIAAAAAGAVLPPALLIGDPSRMLVTFLGLVSASILPAVSLVIGSLSSSGRSVMRIDALAQELMDAIRTLFAILGLVAIVVALLMLIAILPKVGWQLPYSAVEIPDAARRALQSLALLFAVAATCKAMAIPRILVRVLMIRKDIAIHEARKALAETSPSEADIRQMFATREGFGKTVPLDSVRR
ncbi:hypothetical protein EYE42_10515 [Paracoccus subflavus]|uniref:Uncharacterized protein n=1 Tax=Paracoccus subflavus TaxID=2528244 RepID=A0A4Q9G208_9RHOB|nr:hypothetical protein [Paracoccus subflavus]TBN39451.1 hypothetical protein EYE42_10515 [Paracoccus subflavus]